MLHELFIRREAIEQETEAFKQRPHAPNLTLKMFVARFNVNE
jgi:hypothetical protein